MPKLSINFLAGLAALLFFALLTGCNSQPSKPQAANQTASSFNEPQPAWVNQPPSRAGFAFGVGSSEIYGSEGTAINLAKDLAKADLLASLRVEIDSSSHLSTEGSSSSAGDFSLQQNLSQQISSRIPSVELSGIKTLETWVNSQSKTAWALAELNVSQAQLELLAELDEVNQQLLARGLATSGSKLDQVRYVKPSFTQLAKRKQLLQQLDFLGANKQLPHQANQQVEKLEAQIGQLLASLGIRLKANNAAASRLLPQLQQSLTGLGFNLVRQQEDLLIEVELSSSSIQNQGLTHTSASASGQVTHLGRTLHALTSSTRQASSQASVALSKAENELAQDLANQLVTSLYENL